MGILDEDPDGCDDDGMIINEEKFFSVFLQQNIIDNQMIAINGIKMGLSLCERKMLKKRKTSQKVSTSLKDHDSNQQIYHL